MSSEVVKKRGRPKKVICDPIVVEMPESTEKPSTRAKSTKTTKPTKAAPKAVKAKTTLSATKSSLSDASSTSKPASSSLTAAKTAPKSPASPKTESKTPSPAPSKTVPRSPLTPENSKILSQVRELSTKNVPTPADPSKLSKPLPTPISSKAPPETPQASTPPSPPAKPSPSTNTPPTSSKPATLPKPSQTPSGASKPAAKIPLAALNSEIVSNISSRAGARPNPSGSRALPPNYKPVARKVTMAIVAMPIAIVTSWVLYQRLVLGEDQKKLVKPGLTVVESPEAQDLNRESEKTARPS